MRAHEDDPARPIKIGLLAVVGLMSWPVWGAIVAGQRDFTWTVAASALVPLAICMIPVAMAFDLTDRMGTGVRAVEHALHVDNLLHHGHTHRHA
jgi:hypothetical protein